MNSAVGTVARKIAAGHRVTDAEAAYVAIRAFRKLGFKMTWSVAEYALERAAIGRGEREYDEALFEEHSERRRATVGVLIEGME